ncbi:hypothetical protein [Sphaerochaeta sp.]|uniref:hypothetical protein n=1 Tax=Sphaerochaeta sp. TaxID=1972642 RepID=UPI002587738E|nr:hypothetical protein [Sphaerochaeta sp.]
MSIPKTPRGLSNTITRIRTSLSTFKREYGWIDDGAGDRYYLAYLYFLLDDNRRSSEYMRWFNREFPDDIGEPVQLLCMALMLHRMGKDGSSMLGRTMCSNIYLLPFILDEKAEQVDMWYGCNYEESDYLDETPKVIVNAITDKDRQWLYEVYHSDKLQAALHRLIEINKKLLSERQGVRRSTLVTELSDLKKSFT